MAKNETQPGNEMMRESGDTVWVASKLQMKLNLDTFSILDGPNKTKIQGPLKNRIVLNGASLPRGMDLTGKVLPQMEGGYALTEVPKAHWNEWLAQHKDFSALRSGAIFALPDKASAVSKAREMAEFKTGHEPLVPDAKRNGVKTFKEGEGDMDAVA